MLSKAKTNGRLSLSDSEKLVYLVQYDQVTNILLEEYRKNPSSLSSKDLKFLEVALNDLIKKGGFDAVAAKSLIKGGSAAGYTTDNFLNKPKVAAQVSKERGNFLKDPWNYLTYTRNTGVDEDVYNKALTTININQQQRDLSKYGGDAIYASPGGLGMALRGALAAKGMYDIGYGGAAIYDGKYKEGMVRVAGGTLEIVPAAALDLVKVGKNKVNNQTKKRNFESTDPHVADVANYIEKKYPGLIDNVNVPVRRADGSLITDADILLTNGTIIQIKSGGGKGLTSQIQRTETGTGAKTVGYGPDLKPSIIKNGQGKVTKNIDELIEMVK
ncbi:hypothetical protein [uncultured Psychrobacter sp.]|uniref:hypothetical protein n=1 Tax=uncultured Psychrobacter sp. TaxID=259303 RepID=UPI00261D9FEC|nr:hypothetical protein [uncultured Psychrobacter sp.]